MTLFAIKLQQCLPYVMPKAAARTGAQPKLHVEGFPARRSGKTERLGLGRPRACGCRDDSTSSANKLEINLGTWQVHSIPHPRSFAWPSSSNDHPLDTSLPEIAITVSTSCALFNQLEGSLPNVNSERLDIDTSWQHGDCTCWHIEITYIQLFLAHIERVDLGKTYLVRINFETRTFLTPYAFDDCFTNFLVFSV